MTDMATGLKTGCIVARNGHFHAHFSIGKRFPDVTMIDGSEAWPSTQINARLPVANSKTYALGTGNEINPSLSYADLMKHIETGIANGKFVLISRSEIR